MATPPAPQPARSAPPAARRGAAALSAGYGASWWGEGWRVFAASPGVWLGLVVILLVLMFLLVLIPLIGGIAQTLLMPVFAAA
jgi:hypothetical protein